MSVELNFILPCAICAREQKSYHSIYDFMHWVLKSSANKSISDMKIYSVATYSLAFLNKSLVFNWISQKPKEPNEIPVPGKNPETIPTPEPGVVPKKEPGIQPEREPLTVPPTPPPEIPKPPQEQFI
jgi:hypothetical protein